MGCIWTDEKGVSPVVAVLLLLSIFIGVYAIYMTVTIPGEFAAKEKEHMSGVRESFLELQTGVQEMSAGESRSISVQMSANLTSGVFRGPSIGGRLRAVETVVISENTMALWLMDEGSGSTIQDETANNNDGTIYGNVSWTTGKYDYALDFPGASGDYVSVPHSESLAPAGGLPELTVEAWVYVDSSGDYGLIGKWEGWPPIGWYMKAESATDPNKFKYVAVVSCANGGYWGTYIDNAAPLNQWVHLAFTYDGSANQMKLYIDGTDTSYSTWSTGSGGNVQSSTEDLFIGCEHGNSKWFNGVIDEVRIENRVLSDSEIAEHAKRGFLYFEIQNAYYSPQIYAYEHGAVILLQLPENKSLMVSPPTMVSVTPYGAGDNVKVSLQTVQLTGSGEVTGTGTQTLTVSVENVWRTSVPGQPNAENVTIAIHSDYRDAWKDYLVGLVEQLRNEGIYASVDLQNLRLTIHGKNPTSGVRDIYFVREFKDVSIAIS